MPASAGVFHGNISTKWGLPGDLFHMYAFFKEKSFVRMP